MKKIAFALCSLTIAAISIHAQQESNSLPEQGNVGIGTTNPSVKLDVKGKVKIDGEVELPSLPSGNSAANKEFVLIKADGSVEKIYGEVIVREIGDAIYVEKGCSEDELNHPTWSNGINKLYSNCSSVRVGIATNEPRFSLDVHGTGYAQKLALGEVSSNTIQNTFYLRSPYNENYLNELFLIENAERKIFQINNNGVVKAREIVVNAQSWPDYVFEADYVLTPLAEVEAYLKAHKHLPQVPDAKTMETQGNSLAETDKILMQKVEELTLYLIEQNKINQQQAALLKQQAQEIQELKQQLQK